MEESTSINVVAYEWFVMTIHPTSILLQMIFRGCGFTFEGQESSCVFSAVVSKNI